MDDKLNKDMQENNNIDTNLSEDELKEREKLYNSAIKWITDLGLNWTFRSVRYLVDRESISLNQLRSCIFRNDDNSVRYDLELATQYIITSGLINKNTITNEDYKSCKEKALDIMEKWRSEFGFIGILHILLIDIMQRKHHFFMEEKGVKILEYLASKNLQKELVANTMAIDMKTKIAQSQAIQS